MSDPVTTARVLLEQRDMWKLKYERERDRLNFIFTRCLPVSKWETVDGFAKIEIKEFTRHRADVDRLMEEL